MKIELENGTYQFVTVKSKEGQAEKAKREAAKAAAKKAKEAKK